jgi:hypothetical protein
VISMLGLNMSGEAPDLEHDKYVQLRILGATISTPPLVFGIHTFGGYLHWPCSLSRDEYPLFEEMPVVEGDADDKNLSWELCISKLGGGGVWVMYGRRGERGVIRMNKP